MNEKKGCGKVTYARGCLQPVECGFWSTITGLVLCSECEKKRKEKKNG